MRNHRCPIQCIVPPHILQEVVQRGSHAQRAWAWRTFALSEQVRGQRQMLGQIAAMGATPVGEKQRSVYDAQHTDTLPGRLIRREGEGPTADPAVNEAYDGSGATYDLYHDVYDRNSIDDRGMRLDSTVHYLTGYDNAFWNGQQMVYGDGDEDLPVEERLWNRFTIAIDVIGHELTHGVTQYEANLVYRSQSGALNESFSDVFGSLVKQRSLGQTADQADWLIGKGLFTDNVNGEALRSMKAPGTAYDDPVLGKDPQPAHMDDYQDLPFWQDNGGVHINSGIANHAFYWVAIEMGGYAWEKAGLIWYITLRDRLRRNADFQDAADLTFEVAGDLYGTSSAEQNAVQLGWSKVGLTVGAKGPKGKKMRDRLGSRKEMKSRPARHAR